VTTSQAVVTEKSKQRRPVVAEAELGCYKDVAILANVSERTAKRMHALNLIPGACKPFNRAVRFHLPTVRAWLAAGCPALRRRR